MWIRRWGAVFVLIVSLCGALCSCGTRNDEKNVEEQTGKELSRITVVFEGEYNPENDMIIIIDKADAHDGDGKVTIIGIVNKNWMSQSDDNINQLINNYASQHQLWKVNLDDYNNHFWIKTSPGRSC